MNSTEIALWVVDRFWKAIQARPWLRTDRLEAALVQIASTPDAERSQAWAAIMLHAELIENDRLQEVVFALEQRNTHEGPAAIHLEKVGFHVGQTGIANTSDLDNRCLNPLDALRQLQRCGLLNHQATAEIVLAVAGNKMSRISGRSDLFRELAKQLEIPFFISSQSVASACDDNLSGFSNISAKGDRIRDLSGDWDVYAYFGGSSAEQALLSVLDQLDLGGSALGIPSCCREYFSKVWPLACRDQDGDVAYFSLSSPDFAGASGEIDMAWQCNPYGMYAGGGLLWHFPCSLRCHSTIEVVTKRYELLASIDGGFAEDCRRFQQIPVLVRPDRSFHFEASSGNGVMIRPK